jgi:transposase
MKTEKRTTKHYTEEFKKEAVALVTEHGYSVMDAARQLDVHHTSVRAWIKLNHPDFMEGCLV